jgi:hypothetical protein
MNQNIDDNFANRPRFGEAEVREYLAGEARQSNAIHHLLDNQDHTFSVMSHIVCEHCDYCDDQGDCRGRGDPEAVPAKPNAYENQERLEQIGELIEVGAGYQRIERLTLAELADLARRAEESFQADRGDDSAPVTITVRQLSILVHASLNHDYATAPEAGRSLGAPMAQDLDPETAREGQHQPALEPER